MSQEIEKLLGKLQEIRRLRAMLHHELTNHQVPLVIRMYLAQYREERSKQVVEVVEKQVAINCHAPIFDAVGCDGMFRIADMCSECVLLVLELPILIHWLPPEPGCPAAAS